MDTILGQDRAVDILHAALRADRMHHAWIFSGPKGVGKSTCAVELARLLLDPDAAPDLSGRLSADPEGKTSRLISAESHPDLHVIRKELALYSDNPALRNRKLMNIPLDLLRETMIGGRTADDRQHEAPAYRTAALGHGKVFIVDEAELLEPVAQNALLKTLEEPPADTFIFLITSRPERLLPTIRSRCQHVRFGALDDAAMQTWLSRAELDVTPPQREWIERFSEGSPGLAMLAAEYAFHQWHVTLAPMLDELSAGRYPDAMGETMADLVETFAQAWVKAHDNASKDAANKDGARHLLALLASDARRRLASAAGDETQARLWADVIGIQRDAERQLESNVNMKMLMENLVVQWARRGAVTV